MGFAQASTLGSLEALVDFLKVGKISVSGINIRPVHKKNAMQAGSTLEKAREMACIICSDVPVDKDPERVAVEMGIRLFRGDLLQISTRQSTCTGFLDLHAAHASETWAKYINMHTGRQNDAATAYIHSVMDCTNPRVNRVIFESNKAVGVAYVPLVIILINRNSWRLSSKHTSMSLSAVVPSALLKFSSALVCRPLAFSSVVPLRLINKLHCHAMVNHRIWVRGHARDMDMNAPPHGVQLQLTSGNATDPIPIDDTQVAANHGYFQFKATPGVFQLGIREGRGRGIFEMESVGNEGWDSPSVAEVRDEITVTSFEALTLYLRLMRKKGMEKVDVLDEGNNEDVEGLSVILYQINLQSIGTSLSVVCRSEQAEINTFTIASGLLYKVFSRRLSSNFLFLKGRPKCFVGIMILSVLKNIKSTVKFWFIENFLSPLSWNSYRILLQPTTSSTS
ncbi:hypothetical protein E1B28_000804 [Marasmius oreades]|uniref:Uncharacterized protein n=1 Tax=Marasmius oreades TaxID=181124 RepID=A0A9P7V244_9AGAR|nr:uncharacterized protein E1B28_000804 [Marasmius oreades]KAG7098904.1 hypothetical protein E1B28_000804 [Marasmius oreades]